MKKEAQTSPRQAETQHCICQSPIEENPIQLRPEGPWYFWMFTNPRSRSTGEWFSVPTGKGRWNISSWTEVVVSLLPWEPTKQFNVKGAFLRVGGIWQFPAYWGKAAGLLASNCDITILILHYSQISLQSVYKMFIFERGKKRVDILG